VSRDDLLASVHELRPGDLLFVRLNHASVTPKMVDKLMELIRAKVPAGVEVLVGDSDVTLEHYRPAPEPEVAATP
jgi:hypothetical protein